MTGCCGGMGQSEKPEGQCGGMGVPLREVRDKIRVDFKEIAATYHCPIHGVQGIPALEEPGLDEALIYNMPWPVSIGQLKNFFQAGLLKCSDVNCRYHKEWRCPVCRTWTVVEYTEFDGPAWRCPKCPLIIHFAAY